LFAPTLSELRDARSFPQALRLQQTCDALPDIVAHGAHLIEGPAFGIGQRPIVPA
jgi:hypothetical protein